MNLSNLRKHIQNMAHADEHSCVIHMRHMSNISKQAREHILQRASNLTIQCRADTKGSSPLDAFLLEFGLSNKEGVALMCLAEALLRVPDTLTSDRLIAEKIQSGNWKDHNGQSSSLFVNASTWGLMLTGKVVSLDEDITQQPSHWIKNLVSHVGEPVVRLAMMQAMRIMGGQYVLGRTIEEAITRGKQINNDSTRFSFDMLGEGARTNNDAERYFKAYSDAIHNIGKDEVANDVYRANGISVKLSALHPRYHYSHNKLVMDELLPRIRQLCLLAKQYNIGLSIDAEEADRLDLSLDIFENLARDEQLSNWDGLGFVLQAYQKRAPFVASWLIQLAKETKRRLMVRLVKGAYWDAEIKHAQEQGLNDYPVYTRKCNTDLSYQFCSEKLLQAQDCIYPQFATHNAYTAALILELAGNSGFEFQRLHGMGDLLYKHLQHDDAGKNAPIRVYAPVGNHKDLLPYLVRRLLENGANSSFVNRFLDDKTPIETLIKDIDEQVTSVFPYKHKHISTPQTIFQIEGKGRLNSKGLDISSPIDTSLLTNTVERLRETHFEAAPIINGEIINGDKTPINNPADTRQIVGSVCEASAADIDAALNIASQAYPQWNRLGGNQRAQLLEKMANSLELRLNEFVALICLEAGRTLADGLSEVREAVDFCRYYADQARQYCDTSNARQGLGVFLCISPWNFPLAIFTGQIAAALAAGNSVIAKPAEQTPMVAAKAIKLFHQAGIPADVLQLLPGDGARIGSQLLTDSRISGVCFTGSTETALLINKQLAARNGPTAPLIAETGGQNAMVVDSTALPEQVVDDVISSAFLSAGQRCSALRILFLQNDIADVVINMLKGAMESLIVGDPGKLSTDIGPVIDKDAQQMLNDHIASMHKQAIFIGAVNIPENLTNATFVPPHAFELTSLSQLPKEIFGPVLHIIRYNAKELPSVLEQINDTGYGLTLGVHSRIEMIADYIYRNTNVGNTYINRDIVGAVVGVNPFGGHGQSGTGPKAGGPNYLLRFTRSSYSQKNNQTPIDKNPKAEQIDNKQLETMLSQPTMPSQQTMPSQLQVALEKAITVQKKWAQKAVHERTEYLNRTSSLLKAKMIKTNSKNDSLTNTKLTVCADYCQYFSVVANQYLENPKILPGPTGEENILSLHGRGVVLCLATEDSSLENITVQICAAIAGGCAVIVAENPTTNSNDLNELITALHKSGLPNNILQWVAEDAINNTLLDSRINVVAISTSADTYAYRARNILASRQGAIIPLVEVIETINTNSLLDGYALLVRFLNEKTKTDNLVARGGDTQLFNLAE